MTRNISRFCALVLCLPLCLPFTLSAQTNTGTLSGTVVDAAGAVLPNAAVSVKNESSDQVYRTVSDSAGHFSLLGLPAAKYTVEAASLGFTATRKTGLQVSAGQTREVPLALNIGTASDQITVESNASGSIAASLAPMDGLLEARSARTEISSAFVQNFTAPVSDFSEILQMAPGTFSVNSNGVGLGDSKTYFRGFPDGSYDINFDGIPFEDTNSPTHHSWAFFPAPWIGGVDFDRSPGSASTIGPTPFGGSINLLSRDLSPLSNIRGGVTYGSFNTILTDVQFDSGNFGGASKRASLTLDFNRLTSDGFQTLNAQERNAGALKMQLKLTDKTVLTGFAGVVWLDANTPNVKGPTRAQVAQFGYNYLLQNTDSTQLNYVKYNYYHIPTDFEYVGVRSDLRKGWKVDLKAYTYSYYNQQNYTAQPSGGITLKTCAPVLNKTFNVYIDPCGTDKLNSYRKYGETGTLSQASKYGVFRAGLWYEWATTSRHQIPQNPITLLDDALPNFNEQFYTNSYQPFGEYEFHPTRRLTLTGGFKYAYYNQNLTQYADNGKTIGLLGNKPNNSGGVTSGTNNAHPSVNHVGSYSSYLPSADANYRIRENWSVYGQFSTGSLIPPSNVFDTTGANTIVLPKPTGAKTYQGGSVLKLKRVTLNVDGYYTHFQNTYAASTDPNSTSGTDFTQSGDSATKGFEGETNVYITHGLSLYANGTAGTAKYVTQTLNGTSLGNYKEWVANAPANTEALGLTYQQKYLDFGFFHKRIGPMWNDGTSTTGATLNQVIPIDPFSMDNLYLNYSLRDGGRFNGTKVRFTVNNVLNAQNITSVTQTAKAQAYTPGSGDTLGLLPGRSFSLTVTLGFRPTEK